ncbi:MAG: selenocysteine-specific translation elongation factor, partial [Chloroflexota bacterium]|nr:selenocysteine-specific translation elongation factor [Chloroflexota bacterium]
MICTAGHVDHGKSKLVEALTGIDPDRLAEEKEREMTIDLGFAWLTLPSGRRVGIVDVPGHEDFVDNMLAGVGGIDVALFVVAADEGVMPQTREHLAILDLLGVEHGVVALTKADLVDEEWIELAELEVDDLLEGTTLAGVPIVPVSAKTGQGLSDLVAELDRVLENTPLPNDVGRPRLSIDRVFSITGFGTVVTGTLIDGHLELGQGVEILPQGLKTRIRGLETHKERIDLAVPGSRVAINLAGVGTDELSRGDVVALPGQLVSTELLDVELRMLSHAPKPMRHNLSTCFFTGAAKIMARARVIGAEAIKRGQTGWAQLCLAEPTAVVRGDRFVIRRPSPPMTIGGGRILDAHP